MPLLAAKALLLLLLFAFVYAVVMRGIGDLRRVPDKPRPKVRQNGHKLYQLSSPGIPELIVEDSDIMAPETRFQVKRNTISLGRSAASDIMLKSDDYVSGKHARITRHSGLLYVEDEGSTNGTYVNGKQAVGATPLRAGDTVQVGSTVFRYVE